MTREFINCPESKKRKFPAGKDCKVKELWYLILCAKVLSSFRKVAISKLYTVDLILGQYANNEHWVQVEGLHLSPPGAS